MDKELKAETPGIKIRTRVKHKDHQQLLELHGVEVPSRRWDKAPFQALSCNSETLSSVDNLLTEGHQTQAGFSSINQRPRMMVTTSLTGWACSLS